MNCVDQVSKSMLIQMVQLFNSGLTDDEVSDTTLCDLVTVRRCRKFLGFPDEVKEQCDYESGKGFTIDLATRWDQTRLNLLAIAKYGRKAACVKDRNMTFSNSVSAMDR